MRGMNLNEMKLKKINPQYSVEDVAGKINLELVGYNNLRSQINNDLAARINSFCQKFDMELIRIGCTYERFPEGELAFIFDKGGNSYYTIEGIRNSLEE